jgi:prepilin-type N-terminal cleavage/methylation domain-containing protein/prepilin-type processing-associated H-X9-DG protein
MRQIFVRRRRRAGFTIVELLVVIGIIGLLVALLIPAVQYARTSARRIQCQSNLHNVGIAFENYFSAKKNGGRFPNAAQLPSVTPERPSLAKALAGFIEESQEVFKCPDDEQYFPRELISYEYPASRLADKTRNQALVRSNGEKRSLSRLMVLWDLDNFHGPAGEPGARNFLFGDGHVDNAPPDAQ